MQALSTGLSIFLAQNKTAFVDCKQGNSSTTSQTNGPLSLLEYSISLNCMSPGSMQGWQCSQQICHSHGNEPNGRAYLCRFFGCKEEKGLYLKFSAKSCRGILYPTHKPPPPKKTCPKVKIFKVTRLSTVKVSTTQMWTATATMDMPATLRKQPASFAEMSTSCENSYTVRFKHSVVELQCKNGNRILIRFMTTPIKITSISCLPSRTTCFTAPQCGWHCVV